MAKHFHTPKLEELDPNFKSARAGDRYLWMDAFDRRLALRGLAWVNENRRQRSFRRLPDRAAGNLSLGLRVLSHCPASAFLSFFTDSPTIAIRFELENATPMHHMPSVGQSGVELYFRNDTTWHPAAVAMPAAGETLVETDLVVNAPRIRRECRIYLPLYKHLLRAAVGVAPGSFIQPAPAPRGTRPVFFYGTSITQGGCANTAGSDYVSSVGRLLDTEVVNFGFSGGGKGEPEVARLISEIDAAKFVLDYAANVDARQLRRTLPRFVRILRERHPTTPIALISCPSFDKILWDTDTRNLLAAKRDSMMAYYIRAKRSGDTNLHFIDGNGLLPAGIPGAYVDGVHPTSHGFAIMAERLVQQFAAYGNFNPK